MAWQHNADIKFRSKHALPSLGENTDRGTASLYWAYRAPFKARVGGESPLRRLDGLDVDIKSGDRVFIHGHERLGLGWAVGPVTQDNESIWLVAFDTDRNETFAFKDLRRSFDV